jgi:hypothetical protein
LEELRRRGAVVTGKGKEFISKEQRGNDNCCFSDSGQAVKSNCRLAGRVLMIAYKTNRAVVVVGRVVMIMGHSHKGGKKEQQY